MEDVCLHACLTQLQYRVVASQCNVFFFKTPTFFDVNFNGINDGIQYLRHLCIEKLVFTLCLYDVHPLKNHFYIKKMEENKIPCHLFVKVVF